MYEVKTMMSERAFVMAIIGILVFRMFWRWIRHGQHSYVWLRDFAFEIEESIWEIAPVIIISALIAVASAFVFMFLGKI